MFKFPRKQVKQTKKIIDKSIAAVTSKEEFLTKKWVCKTLGLPVPGTDESYASIQFADVVKPGGIAVLSSITSDVTHKPTQEESSKLADKAIADGAKLLITAYQIKDYPCLIVDDVIDAFCKVIIAIRARFSPKAVGITGSIGKTSTTQMVYSVINYKYNTHRNTGSANNLRYIAGVVQELKPEHEVYVQEIMEGPPYRAASILSKMAQPQVAIVTLVGTSHMETFGSQERVLESCLSIQDGMPEDGLLVLNGDDPLQWGAECSREKIYYAIENEEADYRAVNIRTEGDLLLFDVLHDGVKTPVSLHCFGKHNISNALAAFAACKRIGMQEKEIVAGLDTFRTEGIRQNLVHYGGKHIFLDCYNAAIESIISSLDTLTTIPVRNGGRRIAVLADVLEVGEGAEQYHTSIGEHVAAAKIDLLVCYGPYARLIADAVKANSRIPVYYTEHPDELVSYLSENVTGDDVVLYKGSHGMELEHIVDILYGTWFHEEFERYDLKTHLTEDADFQYRIYTDHATVVKKLSKATAVKIPDFVDDVPVTSIGESVFNKSRYTHEVTFPANLRNIRYCAFYKADNIVRITIPSSVRVIDKSAFSNCANLANVVIEDGCTHLGFRSFGNCKNLESIFIPASVLQIDNEAFLNCSRLTISTPKGSYADRYARENNIPVNNTAEPIKSPAGLLGIKDAQDRSGNPYIKADIDFQYKILRDGNRKKNREFAKIDGKWRQKEPKNSGTATILCGGDLMCEPGMSEAAFFDGDYDFRPCFKYLKPALADADFVIANLETIVSERIPYAHEKHKVPHHTGIRYHCNAPVQYLDALRYAGFDGFVLANNHNADGGYAGIVDTLDNLDKWGFPHTGLFRDDREQRILSVDLNGICVAFLSYTEHINRKLDREVLTQEGCNVMLNRYSADRCRRDIRQAKDAGAEFVLVYIHFQGKEYSHEIIDAQRKTAQEIADLGADCIMGSHMHAIQKYDALTSSDGRRVPVMYSLGNLISSDATANLVARRSVMYRLVLKKERGRVVIASESYLPLRVVEGTRYSSYVAFPTLPVFRNNSKSTFFEDAQKLMAEEVGDKIPLMGTEEPAKNK